MILPRQRSAHTSVEPGGRGTSVDLHQPGHPQYRVATLGRIVTLRSNDPNGNSLSPSRMKYQYMYCGEFVIGCSFVSSFSPKIQLK